MTPLRFSYSYRAGWLLSWLLDVLLNHLKDPMSAPIAKEIADNFMAKGAVYALYEFYWGWKAECSFLNF